MNCRTEKQPIEFVVSATVHNGYIPCLSAIQAQAPPFGLPGSLPGAVCVEEQSW
jgi:hypothetical protein